MEIFEKPPARGGFDNNEISKFLHSNYQKALMKGFWIFKMSKASILRKLKAFWNLNEKFLIRLVTLSKFSEFELSVYWTVVQFFN